MNIITSNPIIDEVNFNQEDWYNFGEAAQRRRQTRKSTRQRNKARRQNTKQKRDRTFLQKVNRGVQGLAQSGILDTLAGVGQQGGLNSDMRNTDMTSLPPITLPSTTTNNGMSRNEKLAIGLVIVAALGIGVYFIVKMKSKKVVK